MGEKIINPIPDLFINNPEWKTYVTNVVSLITKHGFTETEAWKKAKRFSEMIYIGYEDGTDTEEIAWAIAG